MTNFAPHRGRPMRLHRWRLGGTGVLLRGMAKGTAKELRALNVRMDPDTYALMIYTYPKEAADTHTPQCQEAIRPCTEARWNTTQTQMSKMSHWRKRMLGVCPGNPDVVCQVARLLLWDALANPTISAMIGTQIRQ
jgi:hypothetical protein